ncbi:uncharacterized protein LOC126968478 [Leptidea sinapis]|uniref:uncharacterized protein LOC126968478 n=1 Tax=Leptidea sinapis TaxID=189913 RepID=UPI0021233331|nr:uncharacterized protein LOC126968478 [Leptidea sinapis]
MDKYVTRERRLDAEYPKGNQMIAFSATSAGNNITMYPVQNPGHRIAPNVQHYYGAPINTPIATYGQNVHNQGQFVSGIDPNYLAAYNDNNGRYVAAAPGKQNPSEMSSYRGSAFHDYHNRYIDDEKFEAYNRSPAAVPAGIQNKHKPTETSPYPVNAYNDYQNRFTDDAKFEAYSSPTGTAGMNVPEISKKVSYEDINIRDNRPQNTNAKVMTKPKDQHEKLNTTSILIKSRSEKLKELHKSGPRVFSGPVEKVMKWHKSLQDIGILVLYEVVAKCVSVRSGESCSKNLVIRDDNGPAMQVVYYEIDYLMPELKPPCTVRVIGRMLAGTNRLHAFNVRMATGDDVATLPRRAAVGAHHVAKLCKEYGPANEKA